jgi:hypothetical protein
MIRNCLKCGHANNGAVGDDREACPGCGAIYSRVEAAWGTRPAAGATASQARASHEAHDVPIGLFAERLRLASLYPTFRALEQLLYWVVLALAALCFTGGLYGAMAGEGTARIGALLVGTFLAVLFVVIAKVTRELSLMLADLADAAVRIASRVRP